MTKYKISIFLILIVVFTSFSQQKKYKTYKVSKGETIETIAKKLSITPYDLLKLNPDVKGNVSEKDIIVIPNMDLSTSDQVEKINLDYLSDKDIIVDNYIYHEVEKKETLYSLLKKYKTEIKVLNKLNPQLLDIGLQYGNVIKIPIQAADLSELSRLAEQGKYTQPYIVKAKETKFGIAKNHGISIAYLEELNPKIIEEGLQADEVIMVPKNIINQNGQTDYTIHTVKKMETFYSLSNMYGISKDELIVANPELKDGVKEGMLLKIPNVVNENEEVFTDRIYDGKNLNIAMMLPFRKKLDTLDFENDRLLKITTDFYLGSLIAIDSLKKQGLSIHLKVYDTENSAYISGLISKKSEFSGYDAIIGPLFLKNVAAVSKNLNFKKPLIISPISSQDHSKIQNKNLVQSKATQEELTKEMIDFLKSNYDNQNLVIIEDENSNLSDTEKSLIDNMRSLDSLKNISILKPKKGYIKLDIIKTKLDSLNKNWIVLIGKDDVLIADVIHNLGVTPENYDLTLFALSKPKGLDNIDNTFLARVNFHYPTTTFFDEQSSLLKQFDQKYKKKYFAYPSKYAVEGFDTTYDVLMRLATGNNFVYQGVSQRLVTKFSYIKNTSGSIINKGIHIIKYDGLELKEVE